MPGHPLAAALRKLSRDDAEVPQLVNDEEAPRCLAMVSIITLASYTEEDEETDDDGKATYVDDDDDNINTRSRLLVTAIHTRLSH